MGSEQQASGQEPHSAPVSDLRGHWRPFFATLGAWALQGAYSALRKTLLSEAWELIKPLLRTWFPELW